MCRHSGQQILSMIANPVLRDRSPIHDVSIIPEREDSGMGELCRQQCLGPWRDSIFGCPCTLHTAGKAMDKNDTERQHESAISILKSTGVVE